MTVGLALAACSSSSAPSGSTTSAPASTSSSAPTASTSASAEPTGGSGAIAAIKANWATFFNPKTPTARRIALLENGQTFAPVIKAQNGQGLAATATSRVTKVSLTGTTQAAVTYDILVSGAVVLPNQPGVAVYQGGVWKVGAKSFCGLLKVENNNKTKGLFPACLSLK